jgi:hypothetical protein
MQQRCKKNRFFAFILWVLLVSAAIYESIKTINIGCKLVTERYNLCSSRKAAYQ